MSIFRFWERAFFISAFGAIALYPLAKGFLPVVFGNGPLLLLFASIGTVAFLALIFFAEFDEAGKGRWAIACALSVAALSPLAGFASSLTSTAAVVWFADAAVAIAVAGYMVSRHITNRLERDFKRHAASAVMHGMGANALVLLLVQLSSFVPPIFIALSAIAVMLAVMLPS